MRFSVVSAVATQRVQTTGLLLCAAGIGACLLAAVSLQHPDEVGHMNPANVRAYVASALAAGVLFAVASGLILWRPPPGRMTLALILLAGLAMRAIMVGTPPLLSTDLYRYVWDGRVQAAGVNPYRYVPADPALTGLRDADTGPTAIYRNINRADMAPTIYPPVAQAIFALTAFVVPGVWGIKALMLAFDLLAMGLTLLILRAAALPLSRVLLYAWNPLVVYEFAGGAHIDALAVGFSALALLAAIRARPGWAGMALAAAVMCKLLPAVLAPALWRPRSWRIPLVASAVVVVGYAAYASVGWRVLGYLPGYAQEEGVAGTGMLLLRLLPAPVPGWAILAYGGGALLLLGALAIRSLWRPATPRAIAVDALWLTTALMVALSPHYPWYLTALAIPATIAPRLTPMWLMLAAPLLYLDPDHDAVLWPAIVFLPAIATLAYDLFRHRLPENFDVRYADRAR